MLKEYTQMIVTKAAEVDVYVLIMYKENEELYLAAGRNLCYNTCLPFLSSAPAAKIEWGVKMVQTDTSSYSTTTSSYSTTAPKVLFVITCFTNELKKSETPVCVKNTGGSHWTMLSNSERY